MNVGAVLLAAGQSRRMGRAKQLLPVGEEPVIRHGLAALRGGGVDKPVVVLGAGGEPVAKLLADDDLPIVWNRDPHSEMVDSIRAGLDLLGAHLSGVFVLPADIPLIRSETIAGLIARHRKHPARILIPCCNGRRGHPPLFPRHILEEVRAAPTLRHLIERDPSRIENVPFDDGGILQDMDTPDDYDQVLRLYRSERKDRK